jgi:hypothetical protein
MKLSRTAFLAVLALLTIPTVSRACSSSSCMGRGREMRHQFKVKVSFDGKPLAGVQVEVSKYPVGDDEYEKVVFTGLTASDGNVRIPELGPGDYDLSASYLALSAGFECFHVLAHPGWRAKGHVNYEWGDEAAAVTGQIRGKLTNGERDPKLPVLERITQLKAVPIAGATLSLRGPSAKEPYITTTGDDGRFAFTGIPDGTYVLHLDAGKSVSGISHQQNDQLIRVSGAAKAICGSAFFYFPARLGT